MVGGTECSCHFSKKKFPSGSIDRISPYFCQRLVETPPVRKESFTWHILGYVLFAEGIWKGDILVADIEELEKMDASEIHAGRLNAKEVLTPKNGETCLNSQSQMESKSIWRRPGSENIHLDTGQP